MQLGIFDYYIIIINIIGFIFYIVNVLLYRFTVDKQIDSVLTITSLLGGSLGIIIAILIIDRKPEKGNMMSRVFVICMLVIQIILFLFIKGFHNDKITFAFWEFFDKWRIFLIYLLVMNVITLIVFGIDKINAAEHRSRIKIVTLLGLAFAGGSIGALIAMYAFRHKTRQDYFTVGVPLIIVMQIVVVFFLMNI